jgi:arylsulfatase A-like enzyme
MTIARGTIARAQDAAARPNIVVIIADDMAWDDCGAFGHPRIRTPNIDRLAARGMKFERAFLTISSCSPSRCSTLTGRYPHSTGAGWLHSPLPADQVGFPGMLKAAGYYTAAAGKWHMGPAAKANFDLVKEGGGPGAEDHWVPVLRDRPKDKPFFLWLAATDPHRGYAPGAIPVPHAPEDAVIPPFLPDAPEVRKDFGMYYDEITRFDTAVGQVVEEVERQGATQNTLIFVFSDNGRPFPRCKTTLYDSGIRTPLVICWPARVKAGGVCRGLVSQVDFAPTLCEAAGVPPSPTFQGKSFAAALADPSARTRDYVFGEHNWHDYQAHERAVRSAKYLYVRNAFPHLTHSPPADAVGSPTFKAMLRLRAEGKLTADQEHCFIAPRPAEELYDVEADPHQLVNIAADAKHTAALDEMRRALDAWVSETDDRVPASPLPDTFDRQTGKPLPRNG